MVWSFVQFKRAARWHLALCCLSTLLYGSTQVVYTYLQTMVIAITLQASLANTTGQRDTEPGRALLYVWAKKRNIRHVQ
uniref:Putative secreted protein n=1 Tax=Ixodes ricinus TaxID=34613 RepID=A0A6B0TXD6_IXORI